MYRGVKFQDASLLSDEYLKEFYESFLMSSKKREGMQEERREEDVFEFLARVSTRIKIEE